MIALLYVYGVGLAWCWDASGELEVSGREEQSKSCDGSEQNERYEYVIHRYMEYETKEKPTSVDISVGQRSKGTP